VVWGGGGRCAAYPFTGPLDYQDVTGRRRYEQLLQTRLCNSLSTQDILGAQPLRWTKTVRAHSLTHSPTFPFGGVRRSAFHEERVCVDTLAEMRWACFGIETTVKRR